MQDSSYIENDFLKKITAIIETNISNENFGVSELAREAGMSRSNLLRKIKSQTNLSVSVFIRQVRLSFAMEMLRQEDLNVSEVSFNVGFSSTSYFIKCFREHYGYPPGEVGKGESGGSGEERKVSPGLSGFFQELKRRKVVRVITIYAAAAFVILELMSIVVEPLQLPEWTLTMVIVLLVIGFIIAVILSWIYDVHPEGGWVKTRPDRQEGEGTRHIESKSWKIASYISFIVIAALIVLQFMTRQNQVQLNTELEKSIAVLPFKNDSNDSTNIYLINGLMESLLDNLQKIEDLRVISRTSVEKYRNNPKTIPEIARELNASYLVEGSGQKIGNQILLNIQLIDASTDKHLWAERYKRETGDIFELQLEVARSIAEAIEAIITPEEAAQIEKLPTANVEAYDYFLQGLDYFQRETREGLEEAIPLFEKAIELDPDFALAHADMAIAYAFMDIYQVEQKYSEQIDFYADRALLLDPKLPQSLIAKATYHNLREEYELALPYLEKALEYHPNSSLVINILSDYYNRFVPNTEKYLEYALMGIKLDIAAHDSTEASYIYLHLSNAFMQSGFVNEAEKYIELSLQYSPENYYAKLLLPYILLAANGDLHQTKELLLKLLEENPGNYDILKELGVICYFLHDYESAHEYFMKMTDLAEADGMDLYEGEKAKIGLILSKLGREEESKVYFREYLDFAANDQSIYKDLSLAAYYAYMGETQKAIEHMDLFSEQEKYPYWYILFLGMDDPLFENVKELPEYQKILQKIELKFWKYHKEIKDTLKEKGLL
ncbi:MAG: helix-turn-helix domain-containing protein [Bacteroidota bacterium]|nr:helix-turn-helix domain-containing protein [Bacteroidota bacterium]